MFELRWITRQTKCKVSCNPGAIGAQMIDGFKSEDVLQYRTIDTASTTPGMQWKEWEDVPHAGLET